MNRTAIGYVIVHSNSERTWVGNVYLDPEEAEADLKAFGYMKEYYGPGYFMMEPSGKGLRKAQVEKTTVRGYFKVLDDR